MIDIEKHLMQWCEDCDNFEPNTTYLSGRTVDGESICKRIVVECVNADICSHAVHQYQKSCENVPITKEIETVVDQKKTIDEQGLASCWTCVFYNVDFGICGNLMKANIDLAENTCCTEYRRKMK